MGFLAQGTCYGTLNEAATAACGAYPLATPTGVISCEGIADGGEGLALIGPGPAASSVASVSFPECDYGAQVRDMNELWGLLLVACACVYAFKQMVYRYVTGSQ